MVFYFGSHVSLSNGLLDAAINVKNAGGNMVQIFLTATGEQKVSKKSEPELLEFCKYLKHNNMKVVIHSSYMINIARTWNDHSWWLKVLQLEIKYAAKINAVGLVVHFGKQLDLTQREGYTNMFTSIMHVLTNTQKYSSVKLLLETTAGQGTEMCHRLEDLAYFYKKITKSSNDIKNRIGICLDTCHIFAAGYNLKSKKNIMSYLESFDKLIGINNIYLIHLNDSKCDVGCRVDRHENIGKGYIGKKNLQILFDYFKKLNKYIILETPNEGYKKEIKALQYKF